MPPEVFHQRIVLSQIFGRTRIYLGDPELIHEVLVRHAPALSKGDDVKRVLGPALGDGLLTADGAAWQWQRQSIAPAFQHRRLLALLPAMIAAAEAARDRCRTGPVDIGHEMMATTFQIIVDTMLSGPTSIDTMRVERDVTDYLRATNWMFALAILRAPAWVPYPGRRRARAAADSLRSTILAMVGARRLSAWPRDDLVALLLGARDPDTGRTMTDTEITDNLLTFITAGHETTALGLGWTLLLLARHPEQEQRVVDEIAAVTGGDAVAAEHIEKLVYTKQVFQEAMRLYPPAPMITRTVETEITLGDRRLQPGTVILVPIYALHRHASLWHDPGSFDPERFAPEQVRARHRYAFMPFGAGPRTCIGSAFATMEAVAVLAVLLKSLRLDGAAAAMPSALMKVTLRPKVKLPLRFRPRQESRAASAA